MTFFTPLLAPTIGEKSLFVRFIAIIPNIKNIKGANLLILQYSINFITKKEFKDKTLLLELQTKNKDADNQNVELSIKYNKRNNILTVYKEKFDKTYIFVQNYKLSVNFNNIEYQKYGDFSETISYK